MNIVQNRQYTNKNNGRIKTKQADKKQCHARQQLDVLKGFTLAYQV